MPLWRIKCHACGTRSPHSTSSGIRQFQCSFCQAWNFLDKQGQYVDPPLQHVQQQQRSELTRVSKDRAGQSQQKQVFCSTCVQNQQIYHESLANYLPDESHPQYAKYEKELPTYKRKLEERYPQICKRCAPKAQAMIHEADYYSMTSNAERLMSQTRGSRRSASPVPLYNRDDGWKRLMRAGLSLAGWAELLSTLYQALWHTYRLFGILLAADNHIDSYAHPKASQCLEEVSRSIFSLSCSEQIASQISKAVVVSACLLWYNHGLIQLYHPGTRYEAVDGKTQHFFIALVVLSARILSLSALYSPMSLSRPQELAVHGFMLLLLLVGRVLAHSSIQARRWRVKGSIMPRPEEKDILGQIAGPAREKHTPYASPTAPSVLLQQERSQRFPIENLTQNQSPRRRFGVGEQLPPSPPGSDYGDPMDIEPAPLTTSNAGALSFGQRQAGWEGMRTNIMSMQDELRAQQEQNRVQPVGDQQSWFGWKSQTTPFQGHLPAAPSSQEKRLRNPISQVPRFQEPPITQRQDFLSQMRQGIDKGRGFRAMSVETEASDATTEARLRTKGQLDLDYSSGWHLPGDGASATGLEDLFGGSFQLEDPNDGRSVVHDSVHDGVQQRSLVVMASAVCVLLVAVVAAAVSDIGGMRRSVCLVLVKGLEVLGY